MRILLTLFGPYYAGSKQRQAPICPSCHRPEGPHRRRPGPLQRYRFRLEQLGRFAQAATAYERAIALKPNHSLALAHQCAVLNEIDTFEAALAACDAAL
ncbi:MAG: tetratricopeptide repeat protein, partial [Cyanobacteria bacterium J06631_9]